jgi:ketosteroid isomerase-like protein
MLSKLEIVRKFWDHFDQANFKAASTLMHEHAVVWEPNSREVFRSREVYIQMHQSNPKPLRIEEIDVLSEVKEGSIVSVVKAYREEEDAENYFIISFFTFAGEKIIEIMEYWSKNGEPPLWRANLNFAEKY